MAETATWFLFDDARTLADWVVAQAVVDRRALDREWTVAQLDIGQGEPMLALSPGTADVPVQVPRRLQRLVSTVQGHLDQGRLVVTQGPERRTGTYALVRPPRTWTNVAQAVPLRPWRSEPESPEVAFQARTRAEFERLVHEHLAVGNPDLQVTTVAGPSGRREWLLRARRASWFVIQRALDPGREVTVFWRVPGTRTWVQWGMEHPLVRHLEDMGEESMLLADREGWRVVEGQGWRDVADVLEFDIRRHTMTPTGRKPKLEVWLRLEPRSEQAQPTLWVLPEERVRDLENILASLEPDDVHGLVVAWLQHEQGPRFLALREAVPGRSAGPDVRQALRHAAGYALVPGLVGLHVPAGSVIGPPLRPERLASVLGLSRQDVTLVDEPPAGRQGLAITRVAETAFRPMDSLVDVLAAMDAEPVRTTLAPADVGDRPFDITAPGPDGGR